MVVTRARTRRLSLLETDSRPSTPQLDTVAELGKLWPNSDPGCFKSKNIISRFKRYRFATCHTSHTSELVHFRCEDSNTNQARILGTR